MKENDALYINENLCRPLQFLTYKIRGALKDKKIQKYNVCKGNVTVTISGKVYKIFHIQDLINLGLAEEEDRVKFLG